MTKDAIYKWTRRVYQRLKDPDFLFKLKRLKDCQGQITVSHGDYTAHIDLKPDCQLIPTVVHEVIHSFDMCMKEKHVLALEREIMGQLSHRQMINILSATVGALHRDLTRKKI